MCLLPLLKDPSSEWDILAGIAIYDNTIEDFKMNNPNNFQL